MDRAEILAAGKAIQAAALDRRSFGPATAASPGDLDAKLAAWAIGTLEEAGVELDDVDRKHLRLIAGFELETLAVVMSLALRSRPTTA